MARLKPLTPAEAKLLEALGRYRLLTPQQAERLGIANITHARERLRSLRTAGLVHVTERGKLAGPNVYVLSHRGAASIAEWSEGRVRPIGRKEAMADTEGLNQRVAIVDVHISLREWAENVGATVNWVRVEFDPNPEGTVSRLFAATTATHEGVRYDPDMIASVTASDGATWLFSIEMETGGRQGRLGNFTGLLEDRLLAMRGDILENALNWPKDGQHKRGRLLFVFKSPDMLQRAIEIVKRFSHDQLESTLPRVFMGALPLDFQDWWNRDGQVFPIQ